MPQQHIKYNQEEEMKGIKTYVFLAAVISLFVFPLAVFAQAPKGDGKVFLAMGTSSIGGVFYIAGGGISNVVQKYYPNIQINAEVTAGTHSNLVLFANKKIHLGLGTNDEAYNAYNGLGRFKGKKVQNIRGVLGAYPAYWQLYALKKSGIKTISDLKGKKISLGSMGSIGNTIGEIILDAYGLKMKKDWTPEYIGHGQGPDALRDGRVDAVLILSGIPVSSIIDITSTHGSNVVFIAPEKEKMKEILKANPYWHEAVIPANTYKGQASDYVTFAHTTILMADASVDNDVIYAITKTILEHNKELMAIHESFSDWTYENATHGIAGIIPFHPGAEKYLREKKIIK
jgi:hypothetical protein